jgi:MFS family permease
MRPLLASSFVVGIYFGLFRSSYMLFLVRGLDLSAGTIGWIIATGGIAALVGGALTERLSLAVGTGRAVVLGLFFVGFGLTLVPLALLIPGAALLLLVLHQLLSDGFETVWDANQGAIRGRVLPANYQGRANAAFEGVNIAGRLSGILVGGAIGSSVFGSGASLLLGGGASMLVGLIVARSRIGRLRSLKELPVARQAKVRREA